MQIRKGTTAAEMDATSEKKAQTVLCQRDSHTPSINKYCTHTKKIFSRKFFDELVRCMVGKGLSSERIINCLFRGDELSLRASVVFHYVK